MNILVANRRDACSNTLKSAIAGIINNGLVIKSFQFRNVGMNTCVRFLLSNSAMEKAEDNSYFSLFIFKISMKLYFVIFPQIKSRPPHCHKYLSQKLVFQFRV